MSFYPLQMYVCSRNKLPRWPWEGTSSQSRVPISITFIGTKIRLQVLNSSSSIGFPNLFHRFSNPEPLLGTPISRLGFNLDLLSKVPNPKTYFMGFPTRPLKVSRGLHFLRTSKGTLWNLYFWQCMINFWKNRVSCKPLNISGFQNKISFPWDYPFSFRFERLGSKKNHEK